VSYDLSATPKHSHTTLGTITRSLYACRPLRQVASMMSTGTTQPSSGSTSVVGPIFVNQHSAQSPACSERIPLEWIRTPRYYKVKLCGMNGVTMTRMGTLGRTKGCAGPATQKTCLRRILTNQEIRLGLRVVCCANCKACVTHPSFNDLLVMLSNALV